MSLWNTNKGILYSFYNVNVPKSIFLTILWFITLIHNDRQSGMTTTEYDNPGYDCVTYSILSKNNLFMTQMLQASTHFFISQRNRIWTWTNEVFVTMKLNCTETKNFHIQNNWDLYKRFGLKDIEIVRNNRRQMINIWSGLVLVWWLVIDSREEMYEWFSYAKMCHAVQHSFYHHNFHSHIIQISSLACSLLAASIHYL